MQREEYQGFTLIEILVVVGLIAIIAAITIVAINPAKNFAQGRDAQRANDVTAILNAISQYVTEGDKTIESFLEATGYPDLNASRIPDSNGNRSEGLLCGTYSASIANNVEAGDNDDGSGIDDEIEYIDIGDGISNSPVLVDDFIVSVPLDPSQSVTYPNGGAGGGTLDLVDTGYDLCVTVGGRILITAVPERTSSISAKR